MSDKNPFEVLGIHPNLAKQLKPQELADIVDSQYHALQKIFHPDVKGKDNVMSRNINAAYSQIGRKNPEGFRMHRERYIALRRTVVDRLEDEMKEEGRRLEWMYHRLTEYMHCIRNLDDSKANVGNIAPGIIRVYDWYRATQLRGDLSPISKAKSKMFYEMIFDENGSISKRQDNKEVKYPHKVLIGSIPEHIAHSHKSIGLLLSQAGTMHSDDIAALLPDENQGERAAVITQNIYPLSFGQFYLLAHLVTPYLERGDHLFCLNLEFGRPYFSYEGNVISIERNRPKTLEKAP